MNLVDNVEKRDLLQTKDSAALVVKLKINNFNNLGFTYYYYKKINGFKEIFKKSKE